ncbi:MAG: DNA polymerase III subunit gamma/tau [Planctomycetales bacterium]|nr:DNA polymerase III subunit gamma/tau [Planctomycetales bacterium]
MVPDAASGDSAQYVVVARRYRPQGFDELVGQQQVSQALGNAIRTQRVGHAYLFTGARGVGKTSTARIFAKALNCIEGPTPSPCGKCDICDSIATGDDVDVLEIDGASNRGIDEIRQLRSNVNVRPSRSRYRIYIIDEVHMLTMPAFNALLKTLEEPPEHVKFIFCTTDPEKIPITVLSRCQRFDFAPVETKEIRRRLAEITIAEGAEADDDALDLIARRAAGSMRDSQSLLEQLLSFSGSHITLDGVHQLLGTARGGRVESLGHSLLRRDTAAVLNEIGASLQEGVDAGQLTEQLLAFFRDVLVAAEGCDAEMALQADAQQWEVMAEAGRAAGVETLLAAMQIIDHALTRMRQSTHVQTLLEMAAVRICHLEMLTDLPKMIAAVRQGLPPVASAPVPASVPSASVPSAAVTPAPKKTAPAAGKAKAPQADPPADSSQEPPAARTAQKKTANRDDESESTPLTSPEPAVPAGNWRPENAAEIWGQALDLLEDMTAEFARMGHSPAISGPNTLVVSFPRRYNLQKESCERPERKLKIEQALAQVAGQNVVLSCRLDEGGETHTPLPKRKNQVSHRQRTRDAERDPLVLQAAELLQADVEKVDPLRQAER